MKKITAISLTFLLLALTAVIVSDTASSEGASGEVLIDSGNGTLTWVTATYTEGDTVGTVLKKAVESSGRTFALNGGNISVNGLETTVIGGGTGLPTFKTAGTSSLTVVSSWKVYAWGTGSWSGTADLSAIYAGGNLALGFYPAGGMPCATPGMRNPHVMIQGDSAASGNQTAVFSSGEKATVKWHNIQSDQGGSCASAVTVGDRIIVKYGSGMSATISDATVVCHNRFTGEKEWIFTYPGILYYETSTPVIVGDSVFIGSGKGYIFKIPLNGPGANNEFVTSFNGKKYTNLDFNGLSDAIPYETGATLTGSLYSTGTGSLIYDSGCIFTTASNGMVYCFNTDLNLIWSFQMGGHTYYTSPVVNGDHLFAGALNGSLYVLSKATGGTPSGKPIAETSVYAETYMGETYGSVSGIAVSGKGTEKTVFVSFGSGRGMSSNVGGIAVYGFNGLDLSKKFYDKTSFGLTPSYFASQDTPRFTGVYFAASKGLFRMDTGGSYELLNDSMYPIKAAPSLVNGKHLYLMSYTSGKFIYKVNTDGKILEYMQQPYSVMNFSTSPVVVAGDYIHASTDSGIYALFGIMEEYVEPSDDSIPWYMPIVIISLIAASILAFLYCFLRFVRKIDKPFRWIRGKMAGYVHGDDLTHNTRSRHRLRVVLLIGILGSVSMFLLGLCMGPTGTLSLGEMLSSLFSAISKGGTGLTPEEMAVFDSRLPRVLAALAVGIGLSVAGAIYQAIIRNPLVDPYIMGVSSGAGTAAVAVIAFNFTFFGIFPPHSIYLTAVTAMVGGVIAFAITMVLAEKSGGSSVNYVLAGVVVGMAFSAVQTLMLTMSGEHLTNAISWLFGSFSGVRWEQVWLIVIPAVSMSLVPLIWAKEFNLVLLGEDQAKQMGLNVRRFNRTMLILASLLTSICVAFVGIIGFVGLVIPHLCRMILGGDHRLVLPASISIGGILMMGADLLSRMVLYGQELPVGAITTIIGIPVFAYLLIRRGRMYDG